VTVPALLAARAAVDPDRAALVVHGVGSLTFAGWYERAAALAAGLVARGLTPGQRVLLVYGTADWLDYAVAYCGVLMAGGVAVPCSDRAAPAELRYVLTHSGADLVLSGRPLSSVRSATVADLSGHGPAEVVVRPGDPAQILYTSGTTGHPKGVLASHRNLTYGASTDPRRRRLGHSDRLLHAFPVGTNAGQTVLLGALDARPTVVTLPRFTPERFARLIAAEAIGSVVVVPAMAIELLDSGALHRHDMSSVQLFGSTAAALPPRVSTGLAAALPAAVIVNYYTSTEAAPAQTSMIFDPERPDSVGQAVDDDLLVTDADGVAVPPGTAGEVWLRNPFPRAYHDDAAATRETFRDGWVRMGDLGRLDADGYLYLVDRQSDVVKSGAYKVSTIAVEAALYEHPAVAEAAAVGLPHPVLGSCVGAVVVPRPGAEAPSLPQLRTFLAGWLADHELPTRLLTLDRLPRNAGGKVVKRRLRDRFDERAAARMEQ
jgi:long-chain acyl-CoA synthetase